MSTWLESSHTNTLQLFKRKEWPGFEKKAYAPVVGNYLQPPEIVFLVVAICLWFVRIYGRVIILKTPGVDDAFVTLALICAIGLTVTHFMAVQWGLGRHYHDLYRPDASKLWLSEFVQEWIFPVGALATKLAILSFYLRFAGAAESSPRFRTAIFITMAFITIWTFGISIALSFACNPLRKWWSYDVPSGWCWTPTTIGTILFVQQALTIISDAIVFMLPIKIIWKIRASRTKKLRMVLVLGLGFVVCVIALIRIPLILEFLKKEDNSWYMYAVYVTLALELDLTIACACLPFCKPVVRAVSPSISKFSSATSSCIREKFDNIVHSKSHNSSRSMSIKSNSKSSQGGTFKSLSRSRSHAASNTQSKIENNPQKGEDPELQQDSPTEGRTTEEIDISSRDVIDIEKGHRQMDRKILPRREIMSLEMLEREISSREIMAGSRRGSRAE